MSVYLIVGASSGVGKAVVEKLDKTGNLLLLVGRDITKLESIGKKLVSSWRPIICNLEEISQVNKIFDSISEKITGVVYASGIDSTVPIKNITFEKYDRLFKINFYSFIEVLKNLTLKKSNNSDYWTSVVAVSSIASTNGGIGQTLYATSKAALEASVKVLAKELHKKKIRVNGVRPGLIDTDMTRNWMAKIGIDEWSQLEKLQLSGVAKPYEIANLIIFLLSSEASHIVGQNIAIDGGGPVNSIF
jgi:NAD(P)-dependent dehydrogenase (short-subunit alcohol dehydrogenase family)